MEAAHLRLGAPGYRLGEDVIIREGHLSHVPQQSCRESRLDARIWMQVPVTKMFFITSFYYKILVLFPQFLLKKFIQGL